MRIVVVSDTHQNTALLEQAVRQAIADGPVDGFIHCGDGVRDLDCVEAALLASNPRIRIYTVKGNCDLGALHYANAELADLNGVRAFVTHGHLYDVKHGLGHLAKAARECGASLACFGHTHQPAVTEKHGVTLINPGSLAAQAANGIAYTQITVDEHKQVCVKNIKLRP